MTKRTQPCAEARELWVRHRAVRDLDGRATWWRRAGRSRRQWRHRAPRECNHRRRGGVKHRSARGHSSPGASDAIVPDESRLADPGPASRRLKESPPSGPVRRRPPPPSAPEAGRLPPAPPAPPPPPAAPRRPFPHLFCALASARANSGPGRPDLEGEHLRARAGALGSRGPPGLRRGPAVPPARLRRSDAPAASSPSRRGGTPRRVWSTPGLSSNAPRSPARPGRMRTSAIEAVVLNRQTENGPGSSPPLCLSMAA